MHECTYCARHSRILAPEVDATVLYRIVSNDVLDDWVPDMSNSDDNWRGGSGNSAKIMCEGKDWPVILDGTEIGVFRVKKYPVIDKLGTNDDVLSRLISETRDL